MSRLLIATVVAAVSTTMLTASPSTFAQGTSSTATPKAPQPKRLIKRKPNPKKAARVDPIPGGSEKWNCSEGLSFMLKGDMKRDQIVTVHWGDKNYNLPREQTTTGADRFHDPASGLDLVVIPTKAMLFSDKDSSRLADECKNAAMTTGAPAPTQSNELKNPSN